MYINRVLVSAPPMLCMLDKFVDFANELDIELIPAKVTQTLTELELVQLLPEFDGWIIGDDPATERVFKSGRRGKLKAAVKWGIGVDNIDFNSCNELKIPITNTPGMFGNEVADIALGYLIGLSRNIVQIDRNIREGQWIKPQGISLMGKKVALLGYGDIGRNTAKRLNCLGMKVIVYDPHITQNDIEDGSTLLTWPLDIGQADFLIITCSLNTQTLHLINDKIFSIMKKGIRIINVSRGPIIKEEHLIKALDNRIVHSVALDVFEKEPLPINSKIRDYEDCILGSHNASNTEEAVTRTSKKAISILSEFLKN